MAVESFFVFYCFCQYIDKVNEENWQNWQSFRSKFCKLKVVWRFMHKILAKYCQKLILMSIFCQFPSLTSSIYWQIQYNTKKLKTSIFWKPYVRFPSNKSYNDQISYPWYPVEFFGDHRSKTKFAKDFPNVICITNCKPRYSKSELKMCFEFWANCHFQWTQKTVHLHCYDSFKWR